MKGYRTVILNIAMTLAMGGSVQVADLPPTWRMALTLGVAAWGLVAILLRVATTTPIGQAAEVKIEHALGITPDQMAELVAKLPQGADMKALTGAVQAVLDDSRALRAAAHPAPVAGA